MKLKIISLNLAGFTDWESRQQKIADFIAGENPDIVLLQEVKYDPARSAYSQSVLLNKSLPSPFQFTHTAVSKFYRPSNGRAFREGLAALSRLPITNSEVLVLTQQADDRHPRIVQNIDVQVGSQQVLVANIHLSNNQYSVDQLKEYISILRSRGEARVIAGDFNIFSLEEHRSLYEEEYVSSVSFKEYISFPSEGRTLDYALIPQGATFEALTTYEGVSDHAGLSFTLTLPEEMGQ